MRKLTALFLVVVLLGAACGSDEENATTEGTDAPADTTPSAGTEPTTSGTTAGRVLHVPDDYGTIQAAVDAATPGDLVLIGAGTYNENVVVETDDIVLRGIDRNEVILDGLHELENGVIVFSNGVAVENMTLHSYTSNGVFFTGDYGQDIWVEGYRASYLTTYNNGLYGVYAFNARNGLIEQSYASGHPDSGFYIGQCQPCNAVVRNVLAENNALGYSGTNAGGELYLIDSEYRNNRIGIVPNSLDSEELAPQANATIVGNYVHDNGNENTPLRNTDWDLAFGGGIVVAGGNNNVVERNLAVDNAFVGIAMALFVDENVYEASDNQVRDNVIRGNGIDLGLLVADPSLGAYGNCFEGNEFTTSAPADIETQAACGAAAAPLDGNGAPNPGSGKFGSVDYTTLPAPGPQTSMPDAETAPAQPASNMPPSIELASISVPTP